MEIWRVEPFSGRSTGLPAELARFGVAGLSLRLTVLQQKLERDFPLTLALDLTDREAADGLPPDLTASIHAMLCAGACAAANRPRTTLVRLGVHVGGNSVILRIEDDGAGLAFKGTYGLNALLAFGVGPQELARQVAACGGQMRLDCQAQGCRIDITLPRVSAQTGASAVPIAVASVPAVAAE